MQERRHHIVQILGGHTKPNDWWDSGRNYTHEVVVLWQMLLLCVYFYQLAGGTGDHRISFDPTSLRRRFLECILLQPQKLLFLLRTWYHLQVEGGT